MARPLPRTRTTNRARPEVASVTPRTLLLAGLGAALLASREAERFAAEAASVPKRLRAGADAAVETAYIEAKKLAKSAGAHIDPLLARVGLPAITALRPAAKRGANRRSTASKAVKVPRRSRVQSA